MKNQHKTIDDMVAVSDQMVETAYAHYEKHLADTRRPDTRRTLIRYLLEYTARMPLRQPVFPPEPKISPGLLIYRHLAESRSENRRYKQ